MEFVILRRAFLDEESPVVEKREILHPPRRTQDDSFFKSLVLGVNQFRAERVPIREQAALHFDGLQGFGDEVDEQHFLVYG